MPRFLNNKYANYTIAVLLLFAIVMYPIVAYAMQKGVEWSFIITSFVFALPILAITLFQLPSWLYRAFVILLTICSIIELTMVDLYKDFLMPGAIISTLWTNPQEASEFYRTNLSEVLNWIPLLLMCALSCLLYKQLTFRKYSLILYGFIVLVPVLFVTYKLKVFYEGNNNPITLRYYMDNRVWNRPPYNVAYASYLAYDRLQKRSMIDHAEEIDMGVCRMTAPNAKEIYVFAIGESLRYENLSLNGSYPRSTTPLLESRKNNLVLFDDYYTQACLTMYSVPMLITRATPTNYDLNYAERSIVENYRQCGFSTYTIVSNTNLLSYEQYLSNGSDSLIIVPNVVEDGEIKSGDKTIVHLIDSLAQCHDKLFVMCQFLGNHSFFTNYEPRYNVYSPNTNEPGVKRSYETLINAYDNSILYTDYILSSILEAIDIPNTISAMMFVSDHGENIGNEGAGHGGNCSPTKHEYHVPLIFWWSDTYAQQYPEKVQNAKENKKKRINGDCVYYSLGSMADISIDSVYNQPSWDVLSEQFVEHTRLILMPDGVTTLNPDAE